MDPDVANLKKRKSFGGPAEELGLPAPKHKCCESATGSNCDSLLIINKGEDDVELLDIQVESSQDSNSSPEDLQVKFDECFGNTDSHDETSTSYSSNLGLGGTSTKAKGFLSLENKENLLFTHDEYHREDNNGWHDFDCLEECKQPRVEGLEEFLSSSGMNSNLYLLSSERRSVDQEIKLGRQKPTIDQEFEQYFSMLML